MKKIDIMKLLLCYILIFAFFHLLKFDSILVDIIRMGIMIIIMIFSLRNFKKNYFINKKILFFLIISLMLSFTIWATIDKFNLNPTNMLRLFYPTFCVIILVFFNNKYCCNEKSLFIFCLGITLYCLFACFYNVITNYSLFPKLLTLKSAYDVNFASYFSNRNIFSFVLYSGVASTIILLILNKNRKKYIYLLISLAFILFNLLLTFSRASIFATVVFFFISSILIFKRKTNLKIFLIFLVMFIILLILPFTRNFILNNIVRFESGVTHRDKILSFGINYFQNHNLFIGSGYINSIKDLIVATSFNKFHNAFLTMIVSQGIIGLLLYISLIIYCLYNSYTLRKYNKVLGSVLLAFIFGYIFNSFFESNVIFFSEYRVFIASVFLALIPLYALNYYKNKEYNDSCYKNLKVEEKDLISIIVPVYNVASYLDKCINSILNQKYKKFELILVDDGSTDESYNICLKYKKADKRIKLLKKTNSGVSSARNYGIKESSGKYLCFIDADDYVDDDYLLILYSNIIKYDADLSIINFYKTYEKCEYLETNILNSLITLYNKKDILNFIYKNGFIWNKLYKKEKLNNLLFNNNVYYREDMQFNYEYCSNIKKAVYCSKSSYHYVQRSDSTLHNNKYDSKMLSHFISLENVIKVYNKADIESIYVKYEILKTAFNLKYRILSLKLDKEVDLKTINDRINKYYNCVLKNDKISFLKKLELRILLKYPVLIGNIKKYLKVAMEWLYE